METAARAAFRASSTLRTPVNSRAAVAAARRSLTRQQLRRGFANSSTVSAASKTWPTFTALGAFSLLAGGATALYTISYPHDKRPTLAESPEGVAKTDESRSVFGSQAFTPTQKDYQEVYDAIAARLIEEDDYDDGSYAPILLRLGWHSSGSYDAETNTGGSNGATMRFDPEGRLPANSGLVHARNFLEPIKARFPWITYADLWILGAICAIQEMGGPSITFRPGRSDRDVSFCSPDGRLPDGAKGPAHLRAIFGRMGFDDQEIVALSGGHAVGRCHVERSGFEGPWSFSPTTFTNAFFRLLIDEEWGERDWKGNRQFQDRGSKSLMMLPTDYCLVQDEAFKGWVQKYADSEEAFFEDFAGVMVKLFELGVPFVEGSEGMELQRSD